MKLGKIFICINILVLSLLMLRNCLGLSIKILVIGLTNIIVLLFQMMDMYSYDIVETEDGYDLEAEKFSVYRDGEVYIERQISTRIEGTYPYHIRQS